MKYSLFGSAGVFLLLLSGCGLFTGGGDTDYKSQDYRVKFSQGSWSAIDPEQSDFAFSDEKSKAILLANSSCRKDLSKNLDRLSETLLGTLNGTKVKKKEKSLFHNREAVDTQASGTLDGIPVNLLIKSTLRNHCLYDFVLISPQTINQPLSDSYQNFLNSVQFLSEN